MNSKSIRLALALGVVASLALGGCKDHGTGGKGDTTQAGDAGGRAPKIVVAASSYDFGQAKQGVNVEHAFKIQNKGNAPLLIQKATGS